MATCNGNYENLVAQTLFLLSIVKRTPLLPSGTVPLQVETLVRYLSVGGKTPHRGIHAKGTTSSQNAAVHLLGPIAAQKLFHHLSQLRVCTRTVVNLPENAMRRSYLRHRNHFVLRNRRNRQIGIEKQILIETGWNGRLASTKNEHGESIHNRCIQSTLHTQPLPYLDTSTPLCTDASSPQMNEFTHTLRSNRSLHALDEPKTLITRPIRLVSFQ